MNDLTITRSGEFDVAHVEGNTDAGVEFVDAYNHEEKMFVVDSGRIIVPAESANTVAAYAQRDGLSVEKKSAP